MTFKQMCETIVKARRLLDPNDTATAEQIYDYSPTGELFQIHFWYAEAIVALKLQDPNYKPPGPSSVYTMAVMLNNGKDPFRFTDDWIREMHEAERNANTE
jgi:hypothetical protein